MPTIGYTVSRRTGRDNIPREDAAENFRRMLLQQRLALGLTVAEAAQKAGFSRSHWNLVELGRRPMKIETLYRIAEVLDLEPGQLLRLTTQNVTRQKHCSNEVSDANFEELARMQAELQRDLNSTPKQETEAW